MSASEHRQRNAHTEVTLYVTDVAGRRIDRDAVNDFVARAHRHAYTGACSVTRDADGKPSLSDDAGKPLPRRCSISHTKDWLLCAFHDDCDIGIDAERPREIDLIRTGSWFFGDQLGEDLQRRETPDRERLFYRAWTAYEALYKCGLRKRRQMPAILAAPIDHAAGYEVCWLRGPRNHYVCVATCGDPPASLARLRIQREATPGFVADETWRCFG